MAFLTDMEEEDLSDMADSDPHYQPTTTDTVLLEEPRLEDDDLTDKADVDPPYVPSDTDGYSSNDIDTYSSTPFGSDDDQDIPAPVVKQVCNRRREPGNPHGHLSRPASSRATGSKRSLRRDYCLFCEEYVPQFARHLRNNHPEEIRVSQFMALPKHSRKRAAIIGAIRREGNFLLFHSGEARPARKTVGVTIDDVLPCPGCKGLFGKKYLWRHKKKCMFVSAGQKYTQGSAQTLLTTGTFSIDPMLAQNVFPSMTADSVSLAAKSDPLICAYGARILKTHKGTHQVNVVSRKMRELARVFIELKKCQPDLPSLIHAMKPECLNDIIQAVQAASGFVEKDGWGSYSAPTFALNMRAALLESCDAAKSLILRNPCIRPGEIPVTATQQLDVMKQTIAADWKFDIGHEASADLARKRMNRVTIVPLAADLAKFKGYLTSTADLAFKHLQINNYDSVAFRTLVEVTFTRVMVLCRKRGGDLARLTVDIYNSCTPRASYDEFKDAVSPTELLLMKRFKRVVVEGKSMETPILFDIDVQDHVALILKCRRHFVDAANRFLFANVNSNRPLIPHKVLKKYANRAELELAEALTARRLRKHLASVCQLLHLTEGETEQLATFMGHTFGVHASQYRLPDDIFQTAKVSKILLMMEQGIAGRYKGLTLDQIDLPMDDDLLDESIPYVQHQVVDAALPIMEGIVGLPARRGEDQGPVAGARQPEEMLPVPQTHITSQNRTTWTPTQRAIVAKYFRAHITSKIPPKKCEVEELRRLNPGVLDNLTFPKIKVFVYNIYCGKMKMPKLT